ncbi:hypothetical protein TIFTF001_042215 [Ficus carica]|uniref:Uncharacterized protein n=1 Tax=Ficus carica TaxID=3494 RepID=A0AA87ZK54_FICCA|nr:hypothetical protein TIFTF001_042215 [Ficus carica]
MALVTHQMQGMVTMELVFHQSFVRLSTHGSYVTLPSRPLPWIKGIKLKRYVTTVHMAARTDRLFLLKWNIYFRPKLKALQISSFKGSAQNGEPGGRASGSKTAKKSIKLKESEGAITESRDPDEILVSYTSEANESVTSSPAIHRLFKKWLTNLRTKSSGEVVDGILEEEPSPREVSETELGTENSERSEILKVVWYHFVSLDATIKIPLLIL